MSNKVIVVGAGPIGLCLSIALAQRGLDVDLVERQDEAALATPAFDGREVALTRASTQLLESLGVWECINKSAIAPIRSARIMDGEHAGFTIDSADIAAERLGVLVPNHAIRQAAWWVARSLARVRVHAGCSVEGVASDANRASVRLTDGRTLEGALVIAADSRFSALRRMQGIATYLHDFGKTMLLFRARHTVARERIAWEWFGHGQTRALLPLGTHLSSFVLTLPTAEVSAFLAQDPESLAHDVAARYEGRLGALTLESPIKSYPLVATWAHRFAGHRFALAGDAAIGMHPVTAHGFNLGLTGVRHLAGIAHWRDCGGPEALRRYERDLRRSAALLFVGTQAVARLFADDRPGALRLRRAILQIGHRVPALGRALGVHVTAAIEDGAPPLRRYAAHAQRVLAPALNGVARGKRD